LAEEAVLRDLGLRVGAHRRAAPDAEVDDDARRVARVDLQRRDRADEEAAVAHLVAEVEPGHLAEDGAVRVATAEERRVARERHQCHEDERRGAEEGDDPES
jgi:hypothetical protein